VNPFAAGMWSRGGGGGGGGGQRKEGRSERGDCSSLLQGGSVLNAEGKKERHGRPGSIAAERGVQKNGKASSHLTEEVLARSKSKRRRAHITNQRR